MGKKSRQPKGQMKIRGKQYTRARRLAPGTAQRPHCDGRPRRGSHTLPMCLGRHDTYWWFWSTAGSETGMSLQDNAVLRFGLLSLQTQRRVKTNSDQQTPMCTHTRTHTITGLSLAEGFLCPVVTSVGLFFCAVPGCAITDKPPCHEKNLNL